MPEPALRPLLDKPDTEWNRPAFTQVWRGKFPGHSVRNERYRYTEWDGGKEGVELYHYQTDPGEPKNLATDRKQAATIAELKSLIAKNWSNQYRPKGGHRR